MLPPRSEADRGGMHRRVGLFLRALATVCPSIDALHIVPPELLGRAGPALDEAQSAFWGVGLRVHLTARRTRKETAWKHYGAGVFRAAEQPALRSYGGPALANEVGRHLATRPGLVLVDRLEAMLPVLNSSVRPVRLLLDLNDVEHKLRWGSLAGARPLERASGLMQLPALTLAERRAVQAAEYSTVCSALDRAHLRRLGFGPRLEVVPNAVTLPDAPPGLGTLPSVLFLGACTYAPNHQAAERLALRIWPLIRARLPGATLILAGKGTDRLPSRNQAPEGIDYRGFVPDLAALYAETRVVCCPLLQGSGTRLKLIEAAAYARPIVSTRLGAEGLNFTDGAEILLRERDEDIALACVDLLTDHAACLRLGDACRAKMAALYNADTIQQQIVSIMQKIAEAGTAYDT